MNDKPVFQNQIQRLNRARGQVEGVARMIHEGRSCGEILTQLRAVRSALKAVEIGILGEQARYCIHAERSRPTHTPDQNIDRIDELMELLTRYGL